MNPASKASYPALPGVSTPGSASDSNLLQSTHKASTTPQLSQNTSSIESGPPNDLTLRNSQDLTMNSPVAGMIDIQTLTKIHDALCLSEDQDDIALAAWIKENYLFDPLEEGRAIRSREAFGKLDKAYKRVRLLTNRAQDKWPFFDRNWKKMSANMVRRVALGEQMLLFESAAPIPVSRLVAHNSGPASNAIPAVHEIPIKISHPLQADSNVPTISQEVGGEAHRDEDTRGTSASGKTNKEAISPPSRFSAAVSTYAHGSSSAIGDLVHSGTTSHMGSPGSHDRPLTTADSEPILTNLDDLPKTTHKRKEKRDRNSNGSFADEPGIPRKKQRGGRYGGRGGAARRSHLSDPIVAESDDASITPPTLEDMVDLKSGDRQASDVIAVNQKLPVRASSRRSKRLSPHAPIGHSEVVNTNNKSQKTLNRQAPVKKIHTAVLDQDTSMADIGVGSQTTEGHTAQEPTNEDLLRLGVSSTSDPQPSTTAARDSPMPGMLPTSASNIGGAEQPDQSRSTKVMEPAVPTDKNATPSVSPIGNIDFIARVGTEDGPLEIPIPLSLLDSSDNLKTCIQEYFSWKSGPGASMPVSFEQFCSIFTRAHQKG